MPTFLTIGYGDEAGYKATAQTVRDRAHAHDDHLRETRAKIARTADPTQVRNHQRHRVERAQGPYMHSHLPVAGFMVLEANDLDHAVALAAETPCAVANGVVEVWPLKD